MTGPADSEPFFLTSGQTSVWLGHCLSPQSADYSTGQYSEIRGPFDADIFAAAARRAITETQALALRFEDRPQGLVQWVSPRITRDWTLAIEDLAGEADPSAAAQQHMQAAMGRPFDPGSDGPLFRWSLLRLAPDHWIWLQIYHHLIVDGFSRDLLLRRVAALYGARLSGGSAPDSPPIALERLLHDPQYRPSTRAWDEDRAFWLGALSDRPDAVSLSDRPDSAARGFRRETRLLPAVARQALEALGRPSGAGLPAVLTAATGLYVSRMTGSADVLLGWQVSGRIGPAARRTAAMLTNIVPLRLGADLSAPLSDLLGEAVSRTRAALRHQRYPYEALRVDLGLEAWTGDLFGVLLNILPFSNDALFGDAPSTTHNLSNGPVRDLTIGIHEAADQALRIDINGNVDRYEAADLAVHADRLILLLENMAGARPETPLGAIAMMDAAERTKVIETFNDTARPAPDVTLMSQFEAQVARDPDATAVIFEGARLSYGALDAQANRLARHLAGEGIGPELVVAVALPRSMEMVVALVAILKAGGAYLPLDMDLPPARLGFMVLDSRPKLVIGTTASLAWIDDDVADPPPVLRLDDPAVAEALAALSPTAIAERISPENLAYVIYTSGSTGAPKGVGNTHAGLVNRLAWMWNALALGSGDRILHKTPWGFDVSVWELVLPLLHGAALVVARPGGHRDPTYLARLIAAEEVTVAHFVPSMLAVFLDDAPLDLCACLRRIVVSGEALSRPLAEACLARLSADLWNLYGPTEAAIDVTAWRCRPDPDPRPPPIGTPIWNTRIYVLDAALAPVPIGVAGELHIAGRGLARGYVNRPDLTAERFIPCPLGPPGGRMYRTGDVARWRPDGALEYLGRRDGQVKVRGARVEVAEIEAALARLDGVGQAAVIPREIAGETRLVGFVTAKAGEAPPDPDGLRDALGSILPDVMVPSALAVLDVMPLTANGKLDRRALPAVSVASGRKYRPPRTEREKRLCALFSELTGADTVGLDDGFFALGGHSLLGLKLLSRMEKLFDVKLPLSVLFLAPTPGALAKRLDDRPDALEFRSLVPLHPDGPAAPAFMIHWMERDLARALARFRPVYGLSWGLAVVGDDDADAAPLPGRIEDIAAHYVLEMRAVRPHGPYHLIGHSAGGLVAYEMARQLALAGESVGLVGLLDTYAPSDAAAPERLPVSGVAANLLRTPPRVLIHYARGRITNRLAQIPRLRRTMIALLPPPETLRLRLVNEASGAYRPEPYPGRIHFFEALTPPFRIRTAKPPPADRRWRELALGGVTVHRIAGDHLEIVKDPLAATTALEIEAAISGPRGGAPNRLRKTERAH